VLFGGSFGVLLLDLDHFKAVNDNFGHTAGDVVLEHVARAISSGLRAGDTVGRWGGEEFLAILPERMKPRPTSWPSAAAFCCATCLRLFPKPAFR